MLEKNTVAKYDSFEIKRPGVWDKYEAALLLDSCIQINNGRNKKDVLSKLSDELREMGRHRGIQIDDTYRNYNGVNWQMAYMNGVYNGEILENRCPQIFVNIYKLYKSEPEEYNKILNESKRMIGSFREEKVVEEKTLDFFTHIDLSFTKPTFVEIEGEQKKDFNDWYDAYLFILKILRKTHYNDLELLKGKCLVGLNSSQLYFTDKPDECKTILIVDDTLYAEGDFDIKDFVTRVKVILNRCIVGYHHLTIRYVEDFSNAPTLEHCESIELKDTELDTSTCEGKKIKELISVKENALFDAIYISELGFSDNIQDVLKRDGRKTLSDLLDATSEQVFNFTSFTEHGRNKIFKKLKSFIDSCDLRDKEEVYCSEAPMYKLFGVNCKEYMDISLLSIEFNNRFRNILKQNKILSIGQLLLYSPAQILTWKNLGRKTVVDSIQKIYYYLKNSNEEVVIKIDKPCTLKKKSNNVFSAVMSYVENGSIDECTLTEKENNDFLKIKDAIDLCGLDFFNSVVSNRTFYTVMLEFLYDNFHNEWEIYNSKNKATKEFIRVVSKYGELMAKPFVEAFLLRSKSDNTFESLLNKTKLNETEIILESFNGNGGYEELFKFYHWINNIDIEMLINDVFSDNMYFGQNKISEESVNKYKQVFVQRAAGFTLEEVGDLFELTRERARQIEKKCINRFGLLYGQGEYDFLSIIRAVYFNDKDVIYKKDMLKIIGKENLSIIWHILQRGVLNCSLYHYIEEIDAICFIPKGEQSINYEKVIEKMPNCFFTDEYEDILSNFSKKYSIDMSILREGIGKYYSVYGKLYSKRIPKVSFMCSYVLKNKFPTGFKIAEPIETQKFHRFLVEFFGEKGNMSYRAIDAKVADIGVLCDRGKYIHPDYIDVKNDVMTIIENYIENNDKDVFSYSEIFDYHKSILQKSKISNRFLLQGIMKHYGCKYILTRDYVTKVKGKNLTLEFEEFAETHREFSKNEFFVAFPSLNNFNLGMLVERSKKVFSIDGGMYMHCCALNVMEGDYRTIREYLTRKCSEGPINSRRVYDDFCLTQIDFINRNNVFAHTKLFGILSYMFEGEFQFSRPYIALTGATVSNKTALLHYLGGIDQIALTDIVDICDENQIVHYSLNQLSKSLSPEYLRIDEEMLMRRELTGVTEDIINEVVEIITEIVNEEGYCVTLNIDSYLFFPNINVEWTPHLVDSILSLANKFKILLIPTKSSYNICQIYVGKDYENDDYQTFILKQVDKAYRNGMFSNKDDIKDWLLEKGLAYTMPGYLEQDDFYYMNEHGILKRK